MTEPLPASQEDDHALWSQLGDLLSARMGMHYPAERRSDLVRGITAAASAFGVDDAAACARWLLSSPLSRARIETLARCLTVGETYLFRDRPAFEALRRDVLPGLLDARARNGRRLQIWSAGCCSGEEPYSIAIMLQQTMPDLQDWDVSILATDIDPDYLHKARAGIYNEWSFRDIPDGIKERYFTPLGKGRHRVDGRTRRMVRFEYLNLVDGVHPGAVTGNTAFDLVFCRNVLMYFSPERAAQVLRRIAMCLADDGWLLVSPVEVPLVDGALLAPVPLMQSLFHRKVGSAVASPSQPTPYFEPTPDSDAAAEPFPRPTPSPPARLPAMALTGAQPSASATEEAEALYRAGRHDEARSRLLARCADSPGDVAALVLLAKCCADLGRLEEAVDWCERALALDKLDSGLCCLLADIHQQRGDEIGAMRMLRRAVYLDADNALAHFSLGTLIRRRSRNAQADHHLRTALALLQRRPGEQVVEGAGGLTAARLAQMLRTTYAAGGVDEIRR